MSKEKLNLDYVKHEERSLNNPKSANSVVLTYTRWRSVLIEQIG